MLGIIGIILLCIGGITAHECIGHDSAMAGFVLGAGLIFFGCAFTLAWFITEHML
jgi:hypothetical protein